MIPLQHQVDGAVGEAVLRKLRHTVLPQVEADCRRVADKLVNFVPVSSGLNQPNQIRARQGGRLRES